MLEFRKVMKGVYNLAEEFEQGEEVEDAVLDAAGWKRGEKK